MEGWRGETKEVCSTGLRTSCANILTVQVIQGSRQQKWHSTPSTVHRVQSLEARTTIATSILRIAPYSMEEDYMAKELWVRIAA